MVDTTVGITRGNYWEESRAPLASLMFVTPLLLFYEFGVVLLGPEAVRELQVVDLPVFVINDIYGGDAYTLGREQYLQMLKERS
mgnify:CR=1 FL=1